MQKAHSGSPRLFGGITLFHYLGYAAIATFAIAYARTRGISATMIGIMVTCFKLSAVAGQFFWGAVADRMQKNRSLFMITCVLSLAVNLGFYFSGSNMAGSLVFYMLMGFVEQPISSNLDTWVLKCFKGDAGVYNTVRSIGNLGNAAFQVGYGILLDATDYACMPWTMPVMIAIAIYLAYRAPEAPLAAGSAEHMKASDLKALFSNKKYIAILAVLLAAGTASVTLWQIKYEIYEALGGTVTYMGYDGFASCIAQCATLYAASHALRHIPSGKRVVAGVVTLLAEIMVYVFAGHPAVPLIGSALGGVGYALILTTTRQMIQYTVDAKVLTTAQSVSDAVLLSVPGVIGGVCGGIVIDLTGLHSLYIICAAIECAAVALSVVLLYNRTEGT